MRFWWVNQNQTYKSEVPGGFMWSPKTRSDGGRNHFYENMERVRPGDVVFSFCDTRIKALGVVSGSAQSSPKPSFGNIGTNWSNDGWLVPVEFAELSNKVRPKDHIGLLLPHLPQKYSPLQTTGDGLQSVYLAEVPATMAFVLIELIGMEYEKVLSSLRNEQNSNEYDGDKEEKAIHGRTDIGPTTKDQLIKARRGQGVFKANVRLHEAGCRITGVTDPQHLRASHIKPWRDSSDEEKLSGLNGLLLSPHIDHLFDKGLISFADNGDLLISPKLDLTILASWKIDKHNVGQFSTEQGLFLAYHRYHVFLA